MRRRMSRSAVPFAWARCGAGSVAALLILTLALPTCAKQKNKNKKSSDESNQPGGPVPMPPLPVSDQINLDIGQMLGAFQLGDVDTMHKYYSDDATFVSGTWEPPVVGWAKYVPLFQREWSAYQGIQILRKNTYIFTHGDVAWASYQWEFDASTEGRPFQARGQTTLVFTKVGENWLIVHNHTSEICQVCPVLAPSREAPQRAPTSGAPASTAPTRP
jgi:ketosteroid isomerase-like protein